MDNRQQTTDNRQQTGQAYALNLSNNCISRFFTLRSFISSKLSTKLFKKIPLALAPVLLLPYSQGSQALTVHTSQVIQGSAPYLTFDGGKTKVTTTTELLGIKLSDGREFTPTTNSSSPANPIELPAVGQSFADIQMLVPPSTNSVSLNELVTNYNYWGDDDGDGQEAGEITATGNLAVSITDKNGKTVNRSEVLMICNAPYKVVISSEEGSLSTRYGVPNSSTFTGDTATYYINPKSSPFICFARPDVIASTETWIHGIKLDHNGPATVWNPDKGFLTQSINPSSYGLNFPTTGVDGFYFDLDIGGIDASQLTWLPVTHGGITATVTRALPNADDYWISDHSVPVTRVTLKGPEAKSQLNSPHPSPITKPNLPQTFELVGRDSRGNTVVKYGFVLQKWFVNGAKNKKRIYSEAETWCRGLGYRVPQIKELTNAVCSGLGAQPRCQGAVGGKPSSNGNYFQRQIGAGVMAEWGSEGGYNNGTIYSWSSDKQGDHRLAAHWLNGPILGIEENGTYDGIDCVTP
ncbi:hypothetical protein A9G40_03450 [Gilliamella sp. Nev3-1]|nr:hypothetical protein A9G40_03450 [Gilliamella apicola]